MFGSATKILKNSVLSNVNSGELRQFQQLKGQFGDAKKTLDNMSQDASAASYSALNKRSRDGVTALRQAERSAVDNPNYLQGQRSNIRMEGMDGGSLFGARTPHRANGGKGLPGAAVEQAAQVTQGTRSRANDLLGDPSTRRKPISGMQGQSAQNGPLELSPLATKFSSRGTGGSGGFNSSSATSGTTVDAGRNFNTVGGATGRASAQTYSFTGNESAKFAGVSGMINNAKNTASEKGSGAYNWAAKQLNLTDAGAAPADFSGKTLAGSAKEAFSWMNRGSGGDVAKKWGTYGAAAVGTRMATGGGITYNSSGQSDIAGIPFI